MEREPEKLWKSVECYPDLMPEVFDGDSLGKALAEEVKPGDRVLIPRALKGNQQLVEALKEVPGVQVDDIGTYETVFEHQGLIDEKAEFDAWTHRLCGVYQRVYRKRICSGRKGAWIIPW